MFGKSSRYAKLIDTTVTDAQGRTLEAKTVRLLPEAGSSFPYTVTETDRLDHLGYRVFRKSGLWWRVCDANPGFMHPQDLIGKSSLKQCVMRLSLDDDRVLPDWNIFLSTVLGINGVEDAAIEETVEVRGHTEVHGGEPRIIFREHFSCMLFITFNAMNTDTVDLYGQIAAVAGSGVNVSVPELISRTGKDIAIPSGRGGG